MNWLCGWDLENFHRSVFFIPMYFFLGGIDDIKINGISVLKLNHNVCPFTFNRLCNEITSCNGENTDQHPFK